jgi:hypothetical protein
VALGYEMLRGIRLAGGVFIGKFGEPISDPSFKASASSSSPHGFSAARLAFDLSPGHGWPGSISALAISRTATITRWHNRSLVLLQVVAKSDQDARR